MNFKTVILLFCYSLLYSQDEMCLEYDSLQTMNIDTSHFILNAYCKVNKESSAVFTYKKDKKNSVLDGKYFVYYKGYLVEEGEYKDGKRKGTLTTYYEGDKVREFIYIFNDSIRFETTYYDNGAVKSTGITKKGTEVGFWYYYFETGVLETKGNYAYIKVTEENVRDVLAKLKTKGIGKNASLKDGEWIYFNRDGTLVRSEKYELGVLKN